MHLENVALFVNDGVGIHAAGLVVDAHDIDIGVGAELGLVSVEHDDLGNVGGIVEGHHGGADLAVIDTTRFISVDHLGHVVIAHGHIALGSIIVVNNGFLVDTIAVGVGINRAVLQTQVDIASGNISLQLGLATMEESRLPAFCVVVAFDIVFAGAIDDHAVIQLSRPEGHDLIVVNGVGHQVAGGIALSLGTGSGSVIGTHELQDGVHGVVVGDRTAKPGLNRAVLGAVVVGIGEILKAVSGGVHVHVIDLGGAVRQQQLDLAGGGQAVDGVSGVQSQSVLGGSALDLTEGHDVAEVVQEEVVLSVKLHAVGLIVTLRDQELDGVILVDVAQNLQAVLLVLLAADLDVVLVVVLVLGVEELHLTGNGLGLLHIGTAAVLDNQHHVALGQIRGSGHDILVVDDHPQPK